MAVIVGAACAVELAVVGVELAVATPWVVVSNVLAPHEVCAHLYRLLEAPVEYGKQLEHVSAQVVVVGHFEHCCRHLENGMSKDLVDRHPAL